MKIIPEPFPHQREIFEKTKDLNAYALLLEMGVGKSKICIDTAVHLYQSGKIGGVFILAPAGVTTNWVRYEFAAHLIESIEQQARFFVYDSSKASTQKHEKECQALLDHKQFAVLCMSYDSLITKRGAKMAGLFLKSRPCLYIVDESRRIKNPTADRTKYALKSGLLAPYKRILTGTPCSQGPFDLYSQMKFLYDDFWRPQGISTYGAFKSYYGVFVRGFVHEAGGVREYPQLVSYRNIDQLYSILDKISVRLTKEDVLRDLPPKLFSRQSYALNVEQKRFYGDLETDFMVIGDNGELITAPLAITRLLRFQQICSGYVPIDKVDDNFEFIDLGKTNPKLDLLLDLCEDVPHKAIIWARFRRSIDQIMKALGDRAVRYDGTTDTEQRSAAQAAFQGVGGPQFFVANAATAGEGLTLTAAKTTYRYERTYNLAMEEQAAARNHRIGQDMPVNYIDFVAEGTIDEEILDALQKKTEIADEILHDSIRLAGRNQLPVLT